jgi:phosphate transport system permease protein
VKKKLGKFIEGILLASSTVTTATVLLIVFFLFSEGISVFKKSPLEGENIVAIHPAAGIDAISATEIKDIFDREINIWSELGGADDSIVLFTFNDLPDYFTEEQTGSDFEHLPVLLDSLVSATPGMIAVYSSEYVMKGHKSKIIDVRNVGLAQFLLGKEWFPTAQPAAQLGVLPLILGTLWVSLFAILFALPIGLATAIYMAEVADSRMRNILKPVIELLAGIPSVVYGFFGLIVIVPAIQNLFNLPVGETALAGSIVLAIMALPTIITVSEDALRNTPRSVKEASLALGANRWQTILRVSLPYSVSGISAAAILGIGRAMGETMAVLMVTGNAAVIPHSLLHPVRTIPATIAAELGEASQGGLHYDALFALGCILFLITMVINIWVESISRKRRRSLA